MDLLTHICSGAAASTVVAAFMEGRPVKRIGVMLAGALGGAFPDIDAISMWSRFDTTFGRLFGLPHSGRIIYGEKFWYSHHAFFHSVVAAVLFAALFGLLSYGVYRLCKRNKQQNIQSYYRANVWVMIAFVAGCVVHLLGDIPTPASVWDGVNMFWPSSAYVGGSGKIWWWNNYDIFLLVFLCALLCFILLFVLRKRARQIVVSSITILTLILVTVQINTRQYSYAYRGNATRYQEMEQQSKDEQQRILGKQLYGCMEWFDRHVPLNF